MNNSKKKGFASLADDLDNRVKVHNVKIRLELERLQTTYMPGTLVRLLQDGGIMKPRHQGITHVTHVKIGDLCSIVGFDAPRTLSTDFIKCKFIHHASGLVHSYFLSYDHHVFAIFEHRFEKVET